MKTTIRIPDPLLDEARKVAAEHKTTLKALVEEGLRRISAERKSRKPLKVRKATFRGKGLQPHVKSAGWDHIGNLIYEGRGGRLL
jgi:hypothetical protein